MKRNAMVGSVLAGWLLACGSVNAETLKLSAAANAQAAAKTALAYAMQKGYATPEVFDKQVFQLSVGKELLGTLVSGRGDVKTEYGTLNFTCFLALVEPDGKVVLTPTVGVGEWEVETCAAVEAVGTVSAQPRTGFGRIVVIHDGSAGRTDTESVVVLAWNPKVRRLEIDLEASKKVAEVPSTIAAVRKALQ